MNDSYEIQFISSKSFDDICSIIESGFSTGFLGDWEVSRRRSFNSASYSYSPKEYGNIFYDFHIFDGNRVSVRVFRSGFGIKSVRKICEEWQNKLS